MHGITMIRLLKTVSSSKYYQKHESCQTNEYKLRTEIILQLAFQLKIVTDEKDTRFLCQSTKFTKNICKE